MRTILRRACKRRTIVTAHEAFGHVVARYHLDQQGIAGISPDQEPSAKRLAELADLVRRTGTTAIFTEELVSPRVADALAREAGGVRTETLNPLEGLSAAEQEAGDDWASIMRDNLTKLRTALGCSWRSVGSTEVPRRTRSGACSVSVVEALTGLFGQRGL
jgi:zinc transport system substrate-binding protein